MHRKQLAHRYRKRVLVVEDDAWIRWFMCDVLSEEGYEVLEAADGRTAIRLVDENPPHVMLLDIAMPGVTGVEVLRHLRSRRRTRTLPVLVVSAYPRVLTPDDEASVACVLTKPLRIDKLLAAVRQALEPDGLLESEVTLADVGSLVALPSLT
jgi:two-component system, sensor histidine kinase and response regulator